MKTKHIFIVMFTMAYSIGFAQTNMLSMDEAIQQALLNRYDIKIQKINTQITKEQTKQIVAKNLPQISSEFDIRYNSKLQTNILPGEIFGQQHSSDKKVQFGTKYNTLWGINISQSIFNPNTISDRKISKLQTEFQQQNETQTELNIKEEVAEAYITALLWKENYKLSEENVKRAEELYLVTQSQSSMAQATEYDLQRSKIDLENAKVIVEQNKKNYELSTSDLLYKIAADSIRNLVLTDNIIDLMEQYSTTLVSYHETDQPELLQQKIQNRIYDQNIKKQNLLYIPTISMYGNYSLQYLNNSLSPISSKSIFPFSYFGIKAVFTIFDGGLIAKTKKEYQLRSTASKYQYLKIKSDYDQETLNTQTNIANAFTDLNYQKKNLELIRDLYKIDTERFNNGVIKASDLNSTNYTLQQTQVNYINSVYNYLIAVIKFRKTIGSL